MSPRFILRRNVECVLKSNFFVYYNRYFHKVIGRMKYVKLSQTDDLMPTLGLGTWQASPEVIESTVYKALDVGYRHIDTAFNYNNEEAIGNAVKKWIDDGKGTRKDLFITTKVNSRHHDYTCPYLALAGQRAAAIFLSTLSRQGLYSAFSVILPLAVMLANLSSVLPLKLPHVGNRASDVKKFLDLQLKRLQMDYVDLYLIHVPFGFHCDPETLTPIVNSNGDYSLDMETDHISTWKVMECCQKEGLTRNLGLSNFNEVQIGKIIGSSTIKPQVLQVELHAYFQQMDLRKFCSDHDIVVTAYAPLGSPGAKDHFVNKYHYSPDAFPDLLGHPEVNDIAKSHGKTPAQILLRYLVQQNVVVIPKSTSEKRLKENSNIYDFGLTPSEINRLKKLDQGENGRIFNFLFWKGVENHPEYPYKFLTLAEDKK